MNHIEAGDFMRVSNVKTETDDKIEITLNMYAEDVSLTLKKHTCIKCDICMTVCPREAISIERKDKEVSIHIDDEKCVLCEVCSHFCPVSAIKLTHNLKSKNILLDHQGVLPFRDRIMIDTGRCPSHCSKNPEGEHRWCRREDDLIDNTYEECPKFCFKCVENCPIDALEMGEEAVEPDESRCLACSRCYDSCEYGSITVTPVFSGEIDIQSSLCPEDCNKCIVTCPTQAITREGKEVVVNERHCSFCGSCVNICDKEAIHMKRNSITAEDGEFTDVWSNAVEKLIG